MFVPPGRPPKGWWAAECDCGWRCAFKWQSDFDRNVADHMATCEQAEGTWHR